MISDLYTQNHVFCFINIELIFRGHHNYIKINKIIQIHIEHLKKIHKISFYYIQYLFSRQVRG